MIDRFHPLARKNESLLLSMTCRVEKRREEKREGRREWSV